MKRLNLIVMISVTFVLLCGSLHAQTTAFTYQGQLKDGANPANGNYDLRFVLFNPATWEELSVVYVDDKAVVNGLFTTEINFGAGVFNGDDRVVSIAVRGGSVDNANRDPATYTVLSPLQKLTPIPYSIFSFNTTDNWVNTTGDNMTGPLTISGSQASVGMVTVTNTAASGYAGFFTGSGTNTVGLYAYSSGTNAWALESFAEGEGASVAGRFDAAGGNNSKAVEGVAGNDAAVTNYGGYFKAEGNTGEGVYGVANGNNGTGGSFASDGTGGRGVYAYTSSANAWALEAFAEGEGSSVGGHFESVGVTGKAVEGIAGNDDAGSVNYGGYFRADGTDGRAVYGQVFGDNAFAIAGIHTPSGNFAYLGAKSVAGYFHGNTETTGEYKYSSARTHYRNVPAAAFHNAYFYALGVQYYDNYNFDGDGFVFLSSDALYLNLCADVELPDGATVTKFEIYYYDNVSPENLTVDAALRKRVLTSTGSSALASLSTTTAGASAVVQSKENATISGGIIDNMNAQYYILVHLTLTGSLADPTPLRFYGARITYTMNTIAP